MPGQITRTADRRLTPRYHLHHKPIIRMEFLDDNVWKPVRSYFQDLSLTGIAFNSDQDLPSGGEVRVYFSTENLGIPLELSGKLIWNRKANHFDDAVMYHYGASFTDVPPATIRILEEAFASHHYKDSVMPDRRAKDRRRGLREGTYFNPVTKEYIHNTQVVLSDTNAVGNVYFAQHFYWQGKIREDWFFNEVENPSSIFAEGIIMITARASTDYKHPTYPGQWVSLRMRAIKLLSRKIEFEFRFVLMNESGSDGELSSLGHQTIVFSKKGQIIHVPPNIAKACKMFAPKP